jgi:hypothetical protein
MPKKINNMFEKITSSKCFTLKLYAFFWLTLFGIYWQTHNAGFVTDFYGWMTNFDTLSFADCINGTNYNIKSFYQVTHLVMYALTYLFRMTGLPWYVVFVSLNALNVVFLYKLFTKIASKLQIENAETITFLGLLMFVSSPYQAEVMVWRASFHYLLGFGFMLSILLLFLNYMEEPKLKHWLGAMLIFIISIFSIEYFLFTPFILLVFILFWYLNAFKKYNFKDLLLRFFVLPLLLVGAYFLMYKTANGKWVAHYGASSENGLFSLNSFSTYGKYVFKHLFFIRYLEHAEKETVFNFFNTPSVSVIVLGLIMAASVLGIVYFKKLSAKGRLLMLNFGFFSILLVPVLNLFFSTLLLNENDRYGYLPSAFLMFGLALGLSYLPKKLFYFSSIGYILLSSFLLLKTNRMWFHAENIRHNLVQNYHWWEGENIVFLNVPDDIRGMYIFRSPSEISGLAESVEIEHQRKIKARTFDVAQYNLTSINDGVSVKMPSRDTAIVTLNQWGNWWWRNGKGASNYENDVFKVQFDYNGCGNCYRLILKDTTVKNTLIYQVGYEMKEVVQK